MSLTSNSRNLLLPVTILAIAAASFFAFKYYQAINIGIVPVVTDTTKCGPCMAYNNVKPSSKLDLNLLRAVTYNYQTGSNGIGKTKSVWLSLEKIQQFIYDIQSKSCICGDSSKLGVRFYFGDYPALDLDWTNGFKNDLNNPNAPEGDFRAKTLLNGNNTYAGITSIFLVPTIFDGSKNVDFDPADNANQCNGYDTAKFIAQVGSDKFNSTSWYLHNSLGISVTALSATNHGDACPPLPPGGGGCPAKGSYTGFDH